MQRLCKSNAMKLAPIAEMPPILSKDTLFPSHRQTSYMILTQTIIFLNDNSKYLSNN